MTILIWGSRIQMELAPSELVALAKEKLRREERTRLLRYKPYPKQAAFHEACGKNNQVLLMAGNRFGKTYCGAAEIGFHMTGLYPDWWTGRRFPRPVKVWACGTTHDKTRDILQSVLLGDPKDPSAFGTGTLPGDLIVGTTRKPGVPNALAAVAVRHVSGGVSVLDFKAYETGATAFMGESKDIVWLDEEPPQDVYSQALARILDRMGLVYLTFTPENGMTPLVAGFLNDPKPGQAIINATWDDALHLDDGMKAQILAALPPHEREMRSKGIPMLGSGLVYPVQEELLSCEPFPIPSYFRRIVGLDFGWDHPTACVWLAWDTESNTFYVYDVYRASTKNIVIHAASIKARGVIPVAWPHDGARHDSGSGDGLANQYREQGVKMLPQHATNPPGPGEKEGQGGIAVEPGIQALLTAMETGRFKVFKHLSDWFQEFRMYHRKDGEIVKLNDDLMAATRYAFQMRRFARANTVGKNTAMAIVEENPLSYAYGL